MIKYGRIGNHMTTSTLANNENAQALSNNPAGSVTNIGQVISNNAKRSAQLQGATVWEPAYDKLVTNAPKRPAPDTSVTGPHAILK